MLDWTSIKQFQMYIKQTVKMHVKIISLNLILLLVFL